MSVAFVTHQTCNTAQVWHAELGGRDYLVAPVVAVRAGVLNGKLVLAEEIAHFVAAWNGIPVPLGHPQERGVFVSANSPDVIRQQVIGRFFNASFDEDRLKGEIWIDVATAQELGGDAVTALEKLENGEPIEVSTAYFCDDEDTAGTWNGIAYDQVSRNLRPDHLAVLLHQTGACSWKDGCGCPRVNSTGGGMATTLQVNYEISLDEQRSRVYDAWVAKFQPTDERVLWVREVFADYVIVAGDPKGLMMYPYMTEGDGSITFGEPVKVRVVYQPTVNRRSVIDALAGAARAIGLFPNEEVDDMADSVVETTQAKKDCGCPETNQAAPAQPLVLPVANQAAVMPELPSEVAELVVLARDLGGVPALRQAIQQVQTNADQRRVQLVAELKANGSTFSEPELASMSTDMLGKLLASMRPADYSGRGGTRAMAANEGQAPVPPSVVMAEVKNG